MGVSHVGCFILMLPFAILFCIMHYFCVVILCEAPSLIFILLWLLAQWNQINHHQVQNPIPASFLSLLSIYASDVFPVSEKCALIFYKSQIMPRPPPIFTTFGDVLVGLRIYSSLSYFSNLHKFVVSKNCQSILFKQHINPGIQGYFYILLILLLAPDSFLFSSVKKFLNEKQRRKGTWQSPLTWTRPQPTQPPLLSLPGKSYLVHR